jgi:hypothetical protein
MCNSEIKITSLWYPKILRENNKILMTEIMEFTNSKKQRRTINNWRIYFQVNLLSEITSLTGDCVCARFIKKNLARSYSYTSKLKWPIQQMASLETYKIWLNYIRYVSGCTRSGKLNTSLGQWFSIKVVNKVINVKYWVHQSKTFIIRKENDNRWYKFSSRSNTYGVYHFSKMKLEIHENIIPNQYIP